MNLKVEIVALAVRYLSNKTNLVRKPDSTSAFLDQIFGLKSYDRRLAEDLIAESEQLCEKVKTARTNRKFKKIVQNY